MNDSEIKREIRQEIRRHMDIILGGYAGGNTQESEDIQDMYPGMPPQEKRPVMHPFGIVSRAPNGIVQVTARQGEHPANRLILGHRDKGRPSDLSEGETLVYSLGKYQCRVLNGQIQVGKDGVYETVVVGDTLNTFLKALLDFYIAHLHIGNLGFYTSVADNAPDVTQLKTNNLDNDKILCKDGGRF
jgi:phage gp45-like